MTLRWLGPVGFVFMLVAGCGSSGESDPGFSPSDQDGGVDASDADATKDSGLDSTIDAAMDTADAPPDGTGPDAQDGAAETGPDAGCSLPPACDAALPDFGSARGFKNNSSKITAAIGSPRHRGRDLFLLEGADAWVLGKFSYGTLDDDIKGEDVDVYLLRGCGSIWKFVGTFATTEDGDHAEVHGVEDTGGRIFVDLTDEGLAPLELGRHRIVMVVAGDLTYTDQFIEVVSPQTRVVVTDIDGTLTSSEYAALTDVVGLPPAEAHPGAADMLWAFAERGYEIFYLTARPEWMAPLSREWLPLRGFPPGVLHTTLSKAGALGSAAVEYKSDELAWLHTHTGIVPSYGFGNKDSDVSAYVGGGIDPSGCYYFELDGDAQGGTIHDDYTQLVSMAEQAPLACF